MLRIGHGYDTHAFEIGKPLILAGVTIPFDKGLKAHSDGDVILHAVCDALLGAAGLGDIGRHFPDTNPDFANMNSRLFLRAIIKKIEAKQFRVNNVDVSVLAQVPKLAPYIDQMELNLSQDLMVQLDQVNIKATTTEKMGFVGRCEGIACYATALITQV